MTESETVTIPLTVYEQLKWSSRLLDALENAGVDNWEWYGDATKHLYADEEDED